MRTNTSQKRTSGLVLTLLGTACATIAGSQTIVDEWSSVQAPPPPQVVPITVDAKETALLLLDLAKQNCDPRPRCIASLPKIQRLTTQARERGVAVIYSLAGKSTMADVRPEVAPRGGEPSVRAGPDKFLNTELDKILKDRGIRTVIVVGTAAEGAVLYTGSGAALRGYRVVVPVDGASSTTPYPEQYTIWHLGNSPRFGWQVTMTRTDLIKF
jgi:nicotinamidase-related amidase